MPRLQVAPSFPANYKKVHFSPLYLCFLQPTLQNLNLSINLFLHNQLLHCRLRSFSRPRRLHDFPSPLNLHSY